MSIQSVSSVRSSSVSHRVPGTMLGPAPNQCVTATPRAGRAPARPNPLLTVGEETRRSGLAENIRRAARVRRLGMNRLSDLAGVSRAQLYAVLAGRSSPSLEWLCKIADALELDPSALLDGM